MPVKCRARAVAAYWPTFAPTPFENVLTLMIITAPVTLAVTSCVGTDVRRRLTLWATPAAPERDGHRRARLSTQQRDDVGDRVSSDGRTTDAGDHIAGAQCAVRW